MSEDKPLHVRVAEALGWIGLTNERAPWWYGYPRSGTALLDAVRDGSGRFRVPDYTTDWSATGPLIEKYRISVFMPDEFCPDKGPWIAGIGGAHGWDDGAVCLSEDVNGPTPLLAVCQLILALHAAGKLEGE